MKTDILFALLWTIGAPVMAADKQELDYPPGWKDCAEKISNGPEKLTQKELSDCSDIALKSGIVYPRSDKEAPKYPEGWEECKKKLETRSSAEWTEKERNECQKKVFEAIKIQKFTPGYKEPTPPRTYMKTGGAQSAYPEGWAECEEKITKPGHTEEEKSKCRKWIVETVEYHNGAPTPPFSADLAAEIRRDPEAEKVILKKANDDAFKPRPVKEKYEGKHVTLEFLGTFENEEKLNNFLENEPASQRKQQSENGYRIKANGKRGYQFVDGKGKIIKEVSRLSDKLSVKEREELRADFEQQLKLLKNPNRRELGRIQNNIKNPPIEYSKSWEIQQGYLVETVRYQHVYTPSGQLTYDEYDADRNYESFELDTKRLRTFIYDHDGSIKAVLEGNESIQIAPNKEYIIGLGPLYTDNVPRVRLIFYDMNGKETQKRILGPRDPYFDPSRDRGKFSPDSKFFSPNLADYGGGSHLLLFNNNGDIVWEKKKSDPGYGYVVLITDVGEVLTDNSQWLDKSGSVKWQMEAPMSSDAVTHNNYIVDMDKKMMLTSNSVSDLSNGKVLESMPEDFFPTMNSVKCVNNQYLKHMGYIASDGGYTSLIYLYRVELKK